MTWPYSATGGGTTACELSTSERLTSAGESSSPELLPTPTASYADRGGQYRSANADGGPHLEEALALLPTPTAGDAKSAGSRNLPGSAANPGVSLSDLFRTGGSTTPRRSTGAATSPPSAAGSESSAAPLPGQLTIEEA